MAADSTRELQSAVDTSHISIGSSSHGMIEVGNSTASPGPEARACGTGSSNETRPSPSAVAMMGAPRQVEEGVLVSVATDTAGIPASLEGGGDGGRQWVAHNSIQTAAASNQHFHVSVIVDVQDKSHLKDLENGTASNQAVVERDVEVADHDYYYQENNGKSLCRICHTGTEAAEIINLGCACKLDLGLAHSSCASTWFQPRGNRRCEICGEIARNVQLANPKVTKQGDPDSITNIPIIDNQDSVNIRINNAVQIDNRGNVRINNEDTVITGSFPMATTQNAVLKISVRNIIFTIVVIGSTIFLIRVLLFR